MRRPGRLLVLLACVLLANLVFVSIGQAKVYVKGYFRKDGTYVQPHYRSNPDGNPYNNWSYPGNTNPYTGKVAPGNPSTYLNNYYNRYSTTTTPKVVPLPAPLGSASNPIKYGNGAVYIGEVLSGKPNGTGTITWPSGDKYTGQFNNGLIQGKGKYSFSDNAVYEGEFKNGKMHGFGTYTWPNGAYYQGQWEEGQWSGWGKFIDTTGNEAEGNFGQGQLNGLGLITFNDGTILLGQFANGRPNGTCYTQRPDGTTFQATWVNGDIETSSVIFITRTNVSQSPLVTNPQVNPYSQVVTNLNGGSNNISSFDFDLFRQALERKKQEEIKRVKEEMNARGLLNSGIAEAEIQKIEGKYKLLIP